MESKILNFANEVKLKNFLFVYDNLRDNVPKCLKNKFKYIDDTHDHNTRNTGKHCVLLPNSRTLVYGLHSITDQSARTWNHLQIALSSENLQQLSRKLCKHKISTYLMQS